LTRSTHIAVDDTDPQRIAFYPYAAARMRDGTVHHIPLDRETTLERATGAAAVLAGTVR
jgi:hypothetical protein